MKISRFANGYILRNQPYNEANKMFLRMMYHRYLTRLATSLPKTIGDRSWPKCPSALSDVSFFLNIILISKIK